MSEQPKVSVQELKMVIIHRDCIIESLKEAGITDVTIRGNSYPINTTALLPTWMSYQVSKNQPQ